MKINLLTRTNHYNRLSKPKAKAEPQEVTDQVQTSSLSATAIVARATEALGIDPKMKTDPKLLKAVMKDMGLADFTPSNPVYGKFLNDALTKPQDLSPMISRVQEGLVEDHPAVCEFLEESLENNWLQKTSKVQEALHYGYALECLTTAMANDVKISQEIRDHLFEKRRDYGIEPQSTLSTFCEVAKDAGIFAAAKTISVDPAMQFVTMTRANGGKGLSKDQVEAFRKDGKLSWLDSQVLKPSDKPSRGQLGMQVNVMEAAVTDYRDGRVDNALTGYILSATAGVQDAPIVFEEGAVLPEEGDQDQPLSAIHARPTGPNNTFPHEGFDSDWTTLYETWNMAFVLGEMDDPQVLLPKLLIPSLLCAEPEHYVGARTLSLWLSVNTYLSRRLRGVEPVKGPENKEEMARAWGRINRKYALQMAEEKLGSKPAESTAEFQKEFKHPILSFAKLASKYVV